MDGGLRGLFSSVLNTRCKGMEFMLLRLWICLMGK